jgi:hypothetical protein
MRSQSIKDYIKKHQALFWYSPGDKSETVSDELLVETVINCGSLRDIRELFDSMGLEKTASIFRHMTDRKALNIYPELRNYFELYFNKYAPRDTQSEQNPAKRPN